MVKDGKWQGAQPQSSVGHGSTWDDEGNGDDQGRPGGGSRSNEKLVVPEFAGEAGEADLGKSARSYLRKVAAWLKCTRMPERDRGVALYTNLSGKAWVFAEELDVDRLAQAGGVQYFQDWIRVRFMEMEVTKVSNVMAELFRRCRKKPEQTVRDFNVEFERLLLHLKELDCELPGLVKAWLYLDKLKVTEAEELALLSSVHNQYDVKLLQQAAILHDRGVKKSWERGGQRWNNNYQGGAKTVHVTNHGDQSSEEEQDGLGDEEPSDSELVSENVAEHYHSAFMAFQDAKSKYREAMKGRGVDPSELKRRSEDRLKAAKAKSFCAACKRRGHWHRDPECPLRNRSSTASSSGGEGAPKTVQVCNHVQMCYMTSGSAENYEAENARVATTVPGEVRDNDNAGGQFHMLAIADTACTKAVAGHRWYEQYCQMADEKGWEIEIIEEHDRFKFGASRVHDSQFAVMANFAIQKQHFKAKIAIVQCDVPLLFSRTVLIFLGMTYHVDGQRSDLRSLGLEGVMMETSPTGHPSFHVTDYPADMTFQLSKDWTTVDERVKFPILDPLPGNVNLAEHDAGAESAYKEHSGPVGKDGSGIKKFLFYPKKIPIEIENMLKEPDLSRVAFFTWWKSANQSRDFWIETSDSLVRVHVVPRKFPFDPSAWKTPLRDMKHQLLETLDDIRFTDVIPCHAEGLQEMRHQGLWRSNNLQSGQDRMGGMFENLWIGRSCFKKRISKCEPKPILQASNASIECGSTVALAMEDEPGAAGGVGALRDCHPPEVAGAGAAADGDRAEGDSESPGSGQSGHRAVEAEAGGPHQQGKGAGLGGAAEANTGNLAEDDPRGLTATFGECDDLRQVSKLALQGSAGGLHGMEHQRGEGEQQLLAGSEAVRNLGNSGAGRTEGSCKDYGESASGRGPGGESGHRSARRRLCDVLDVFSKHGVGKEGSSSAEREASAESGGRSGKDIDGSRAHRGGQSGVGDASDSTGSYEAEVSPASSWGSAVKKRLKGWWDGSARHQPSMELSTSLRDTDIVAENDKALGLGSEGEYDMQNEYKAEVGLSTETEYKATLEEAFVMEVEHESMSDASAAMSPRERAVEGMRRRRDAKRPVRKKLVAMGRKLHQVLLASAFALGSMANECIVEPGMDFLSHAVHGSDHGSKDQPELLEIFAGSANLSGAFAAARCGVMRPVDIVYGDDLRQENARQDLYHKIKKEKPKLVWLAPPCTAWCGFSRLNFSKQELRRRRRKEKVFIELMDEIMLLQLAGGRDVIVENPLTSDLWRDPIMARWCSDRSMSFFRTDLCQYGMVSRDKKELLRKPIKLLATNAVYREELEARCDDMHSHRVIQGVETAHSAEYPEQFAAAVMRASRRASKQHSHEVFMNQEDDLDELMGEMELNPEGAMVAKETEQPIVQSGGAEDITFKGPIKAVVAGALKRLHQNLGHPPRRELVRHLRLGGASQDMVEGAERLECKTCAHCAQPKPHRVAKPAALLDFNEAVALDIIFLDTLDTTGHLALNMVDMASTYQVVIPIPNRKSSTVADTFYRHWISWAGVPGRLVLDLDTAFQDSFWELTSDESISMRAAAGQAHWQNGIAERYGSTWKDVWQRLCKMQGIRDHEIHDAAGAVSEARNSLRNRSGFSPRQWVFGTNGKTLSNLEDDEDWSTMSAITSDEKMGRKHAMKIAARAAFFEVQNGAAIKKALAHRARVKPRQYQPGDLVYIYRADPSNKKTKAKWIGPATIIGAEGSNYWAARGGRCLLAAAEHLRPADHEEVSLTLRVKAAIREVNKALDKEFADVADGPEDMEVESEGEAVPRGSAEKPTSSEMEVDHGNRRRKAEDIEKKHKTLKKQAKLLDDVPISLKGGGQPRTFFTKHGLTGEALEKALDKELPWNMIPPEEKEMYREAELKQWKEHMDFGAVRPLSLAESKDIENKIGKERILPARFCIETRIGPAEEWIQRWLANQRHVCVLGARKILTLVKWRWMWTPRRLAGMQCSLDFWWAWAEGGWSQLETSERHFSTELRHLGGFTSVSQWGEFHHWRLDNSSRSSREFSAWPHRPNFGGWSYPRSY